MPSKRPDIDVVPPAYVMTRALFKIRFEASHGRETRWQKHVLQRLLSNPNAAADSGDPMSDHEDVDPIEVASLVREDATLDGAAILRLLDKPLTAEDLREATERVSRPLATTEEATQRLLVFREDSELMAFETAYVSQVARAAHVHRVPHRSNKMFRGLCNLDGELLLCADLRALLGLDPATAETISDPERRMIVLGDIADRWVVEVDGVLGVAPAARHEFRRPPITVDAALARYTKSLVTLKQGTAAVLDVERVLAGAQAALR